MTNFKKIIAGTLLALSLISTTAAYAEEAPEKPAPVTTANADAKV